MILTLFLMFVRRLFIWRPLHPAGYALSTNLIGTGVYSLPQYSGNMVQFERSTATVILLAKGALLTNLTNLQKRIALEREDRGFVTDPVKLAVLLSEEVGEIASEIKRLWSKNYDQFCADRLEEEIADAFVVLSALANQFDIDLENAIERKFFDKDAQREWKSAQVRKR